MGRGSERPHDSRWCSPVRVRNRRYELIAATRDAGQIPPAGLSIAKRLAKAGDMNPESAIIGEGIGPDAGEELGLADKLAGAFHEYCQNIEGAAPEPNGSFIFQQQLLCRQETERPERDCPFDS